MNWIAIIIALAAGFGLGLAAARIFGLMQAKNARELADELFRDSESRRQAELDAVIANMKDSFGNLSLEALSKANDELVKLGKSVLATEREAGAKDLGEKKGLIDQQLKEMTTRLENVSSLMKELEKDREQKFGEVSQHLKNAGERTAELQQTTHSLREALASTKARGQWGERMAEDVLRMAGFVENVNYIKQKATEGGKIPDFTFSLPKELTLNMDAKFPLDNYMRYLESETPTEKEKYCKDFLKDVKARVKEVKSREYIDPGGGTVDYALLFIPNEQVYAFIHEQDSTILDNALKDKVVFCSPITLFAVLAIIRQAVDNFALEKASNQMLSHFGRFENEWRKFLEKLEALGKKIAGAHSDYEALITTRRRKLDKPLNEIDSLRTRRGLPVAPLDDGEPLDDDNLPLSGGGDDRAPELQEAGAEPMARVAEES